ncbi:unnamed protein product [Phyllotreta striolata]|uniref:endo-polygalacturonase n=1 Tax=Phyllotreta striolata TaxID=444603 RepID=A0A9N9TNL9_PHYSR|nr:unnamed protein product [Phyllotreta striolata]
MSLKILCLLFSVTFAKAAGQTGCTITEYKQVDDVLKRCTNITISNLTMPGGIQLKLDLQKGSTLTFEGTTVFEVAHWEGHLVEVTGEGVLVQGAPGSILNAQGEKYWDGQGGNGGLTKPKFFKIGTTGGSVFRHIYLLNCAHFCVGITASDVHVHHFTIDVVAGNLRGGLNTDGFGVSNSHNVLIEDSVVMNQDDCVVVNRGTNMVFRNLQCYGTHGLSFSVGDSHKDAVNGVTKNITFEDCHVADGLYGIHFKTKRGTGLVTDVTYKNIKLSGIQEDGIYINQDYGDIGNTSRSLQIANLSINNVYGSMNGALARPVHVVCNENACSNWNWSGISIEGTGKNYCNFSPNGFNC